MSYGVIYSLTLFDGRTYVGLTTKNPNNYYQMEYVTNKGNKRPLLSNAIKKYGIDAFHFDVIDIADNKEDLDKKEKYWIICMSAHKSLGGFNLQWGGHNGKHDESSKEKMSKTRKDGIRSGKIVLNKSKCFKKGNIPWSKGKTIEEMGIKHPTKGIGHTEETKKKMSEIAKQQYANGRVSHMKGKKRTIESNKKISESNMKRKKWINIITGEIKYHSVTEMDSMGYIISQNYYKNGKSKGWELCHEN